MKKKSIITKLLAGLSLLGTMTGGGPRTQASETKLTQTFQTVDEEKWTSPVPWKVVPRTTEEKAAAAGSLATKLVEGMKTQGEWENFTWAAGTNNMAADQQNANSVIKIPMNKPDLNNPDFAKIQEVAEALTKASAIGDTDATKNTQHVGDAKEKVKVLQKLGTDLKLETYRVKKGTWDKPMPGTSEFFWGNGQKGVVVGVYNGELTIQRGKWKNGLPLSGEEQIGDLKKLYDGKNLGGNWLTPTWEADSSGNDYKRGGNLGPDDPQVTDSRLLPKNVYVDMDGCLRNTDGSYAAVDLGETGGEKIVAGGSIKIKTVKNASESTKVGKELLGILSVQGSDNSNNSKKVLEEVCFEAKKTAENELKFITNDDGTVTPVNKYGQKVDWNGKEVQKELKINTTGQALKWTPNGLEDYPAYLVSLEMKEDDTELLDVLRKGGDLPRKHFLRLQKITEKEGDEKVTKYVFTNWDGTAWVGDPEVIGEGNNRKLNWVKDMKNAKKMKENDTFNIPGITENNTVDEKNIELLTRGTFWFRHISTTKLRYVVIGVGVTTGVGLAAGGGFLLWNHYGNKKPNTTKGGDRNRKLVEKRRGQSDNKPGKSF